MGFLAPWFLAGVAAIGLPVWIHLLRQYRSTPHPFSSLMFFERRVQSSVKHKRLRYLALLSLRILLLILMALAFANPFVARSGVTAGGRRLQILAIDDSFSMRYGDHFTKAKQGALDLVASLNPGDRGQVLALDSQVHFLTQQTQDLAQMRSAIQALEPGDARSSYAELSRALRSVAESIKRPIDVHFFTDVQKSSMPPAFTDLRLADDTNLVVHSVASGREPNWMVESVTAPGRIFDPKKVRVQAVIAGSDTEAAHKNVSLVLDGKVLETKPVDVPANGRAHVEFIALESPYGFHRGEVRIDSTDQLPGDDHFPFAVERADPNRILFLHHGGQGRDLLYFKTALESASEAGFIVEPLPAEQVGGQSLSKYPFVVLSDVGALPSGLEENLRAYVSAGGSLLIALGPASPAGRTVPVFNEPIVDTRYASREGDRFQTVATVDPEYPPVRKANKLEGVQFFQTIRVQPGNARVAAKLTDDTPLLLEKRIGEGRVVVFTSTFDNISNDFPLHPSFLPFIEQTARYLGGQQDRSSNLAVDDFIELRSKKDQGAAADVIDPDGKHALSLKEAAAVESFKVTREGFYEVHRANGKPGIGCRPLRSPRIGSLHGFEGRPRPLAQHRTWIRQPGPRHCGQSDPPLEPLALCPVYTVVDCYHRVAVSRPLSVRRQGGCMNALDQLNGYLRSIERRLRFFAVSRGAAIVAAAALFITLLLVVITNQYAFSERSLLIARIVLFVSLGVAVAFGLVIPLLGLTRRHAAHRAEARFPEFNERLLTVTENKDMGNPFVHLVADDALQIARTSTPQRFISGGAIFGFLGSAALAAIILGWLFLAGPGYLGYGTSVLWAGVAKDGTHTLYDLIVTPGDRTVRRGSDQLITARPMGFEAQKVRLYARYGAASKWEQLNMQAEPHGSAFEFLIANVSDTVEYYVEAGAINSKHYNLRTIDLPNIKKVRVTYHFPSWTGLHDATEDPGGDLRAVEGTQAEVAIETDRPLTSGIIMVNDDSQIALKSSGGNWLTARVPVDKDGMYHIAALERGDNVRLSEDYFIEAQKDTPPVVKLVRPGRDAKVNPIEEVARRGRSQRRLRPARIEPALFRQRRSRENCRHASARRRKTCHR